MNKAFYTELTQKTRRNKKIARIFRDCTQYINLTTENNSFFLSLSRINLNGAHSVQLNKTFVERIMKNRTRTNDSARKIRHMQFEAPRRLLFCNKGKPTMTDFYRRSFHRIVRRTHSLSTHTQQTTLRYIETSMEVE